MFNWFKNLFKTTDEDINDSMGELPLVGETVRFMNGNEYTVVDVFPIDSERNEHHVSLVYTKGAYDTGTFP